MTFCERIFTRTGGINGSNIWHVLWDWERGRGREGMVKYFVYRGSFIAFVVLVNNGDAFYTSPVQGFYDEYDVSLKI